MKVCLSRAILIAIYVMTIEINDIYRGFIELIGCAADVMTKWISAIGNTGWPLFRMMAAVIGSNSEMWQ